MRLTSLVLCLVMLSGSFCLDAPPASAAISTIRLTSNPASIYADGRSICSISAEVRDESGDTLSDGSEVRFTTSLGIIDSSATTIGGVARVMLRSGIQPGRAMVSAVLAQGQAVSQLQVEFLAPGTKMETDAYVTISSDRYLAYAADSKIIDASGGSTVEHRGLKVRAESIQMDVGRNVLRARGKTGSDPIQISRGGKSVRASLLSYDMNTLQGMMVTEGEDGKLANLLFNGVDMSTSAPPDQINQSAFEFQDLSATEVLVKAKSILIRPKHDLQFKKAELYMEGDKAFRLPLYLIPMAAAGPAAGFQYFGVTSSGFKVDIPLYYSLTPSGTGAVRVRNQQGGWSSNSSLPTWGLDVEQTYATGKAEGKFTVGQATRRDWGLNWSHMQELGTGSTLTSYFDFPAHRDIFGLVNYNRAFDACSLGLRVQGGSNRATDTRTNVTTANQSLSSNIYLQTNPRKYGSLLNYSFLFQTSFANRVTTTSGTKNTVGSGMNSGIQLQMRGMPVSFGKKAHLNTSLSVGRDWGANRSGMSVLGNAMFATTLGQSSSLGLGYAYTLSPAFTTLYGHHSLSFNYGLFGGKWAVSLVGIHTLDQPITSAYCDLAYQLSPAWKLNVRGNYQMFPKWIADDKGDQQRSGTIDSGDMEFGVGHMIGSQEVDVIYSRSLHRFRIEMGALGF
jgi:hypothetical protein